MIYCDQNFNFSDFKNLSFILNDIEYEFILTYKDLFIEKDDKYLFGIVFDNIDDKDKSYWIFGKLFMKKYQLFFDLDKKIIGLYRNKNNKGESKKKFNIIYIFLIILVLIVIGLVVAIVYLVKNKRKSRANELTDENFDYIPSN